MKTMTIEIDDILASAERGGIKVELTWIGEGWRGDYNEDDPYDEPLVRFDIYYNGEAVDDASCCTCVNAESDVGYLQRIADRILREVHDPIIGGYSVKGLCDSLSWIN